MGSQINPVRPKVEGPAGPASAPRLIREAAKQPRDGAKVPPRRYTSELRGEAAGGSKLAMFRPKG